MVTATRMDLLRPPNSTGSPGIIVVCNEVGLKRELFLFPEGLFIDLRVDGFC